MDTVYSGLSTFGNIQAIYSLLFVGLIATIFILIGIFLVRKKTIYTSKYMTRGIALENSACSRQHNGPHNTTITCSTEYSYIVPGDKTIYKGVSDSAYYNKGDTLDVYYNPNDHGQSQLQPDEFNLIGGFFIGIGVLAIVVVSLNAFFTYKYKPYAAYEGAQGVVNAFIPNNWNY